MAKRPGSDTSKQEAWFWFFDIEKEKNPENNGNRNLF